MKINHPVTQVERPVLTGTTLVTKTDLKGQITFVNREFVEISGFSEEELVGSSHNIVRHPDMPPAAFEDLWHTIKAGRPWVGLVKNRCKNGDHYWVEAHVIPMTQQGHTLGYMSVRRGATRDQIQAAEVRYARMGTGKTKLDPESWLTRLDPLRRLSLGYQMLMLMVLLGLPYVFLLWNQWKTDVLSLGLLADLVLSLGIGGLIARRVSAPVRHAIEVFRRMMEDDYATRILLERRGDELGTLMAELKKMQVKLGFEVAEARERAAAALRIQQALDSSETPSTVSNEDGTLIFVNQAAFRLLKRLEDGIRQNHAKFSVNRLLGTKLGSLSSDAEWVRVYGQKLEKTIIFRTRMAGRTLELDVSPVVDGQGRYAGQVTQWADITDQLDLAQAEQSRVEAERQIAATNLRLKVALDHVSSNVMLADGDHNIIYMNHKALALFRAAEAGIRQDMPGFMADKIIGSNVDIFHKNPAHQRGLLPHLKPNHLTEFQLGGRILRFIANPVINGEGQRLGTVVEWTDRTAEVAVEKEIATIVTGAQRGDLSRRIGIDGKQGFFLLLGEGINRLIEVIDQVIRDMSHTMQALAGGDLTQRIVAEHQGAFGEIKTHVNTTLGNLGDIVSRLLEAADVIATASHEISSGNNNLSVRTEQQASSLQETAASMEQLTSAVRNNANNSQQANQVAANARQMAQRGGQVVQNAVLAMNAINSASRKIAEIIGVIDEIAFQTNLLALNASVEAARADEQGRGFAVVASEVRNLASRSAAAAKEIKGLIKDSVDKVQVGADLVNESGSTLGGIVESVKKMGDIIGEIALASREQSSGIDQVNQAVTNMDEMTQQNAALAEETSSASVSMREKAQEMKEMISFFKLQARPMTSNVSRSRAPAVPPRTLAARATAPLKKPQAPQTTRHPAPPVAAKFASAKTFVPTKPAPRGTAKEDEWEEF
ncbi:MAG: methyl-accepting chemotaxis protein [Pseudomonadota bacterium]